MTTVVLLCIFGMGDATKLEKRARTEQAKKIVLIMTPAYVKKVATLELSPAEAAQKFIERRGQESPDKEHVVLGVHYVIVGDDYVFSLPHKFAIPLSGIYVNGRSGEARRVSHAGYVNQRDRAKWAKRIDKTPRETVRHWKYPWLQMESAERVE